MLAPSYVSGAHAWNGTTAALRNSASSTSTTALRVMTSPEASAGPKASTLIDPVAPYSSDTPMRNVADAAPLSTIVAVVRTRSAATLHLPLAVMQIVNGGLWLGYGLAVSDPFIWVPNAIGTITGTILCALIFVFRTGSRRHKESPAPSEAETTSSQRQLHTDRGGEADEEEPGNLA